MRARGTTRTLVRVIKCERSDGAIGDTKSEARVGSAPCAYRRQCGVEQERREQRLEGVLELWGTVVGELDVAV